MVDSELNGLLMFYGSNLWIVYDFGSNLFIVNDLSEYFVLCGLKSEVTGAFTGIESGFICF